jgi:hypothetical protein
MMKLSPLFVAAAAVAFFSSGGVSSASGVDTNDPLLMPPRGAYVSETDVATSYSNSVLSVDLTNMRLSPVYGATVQTAAQDVNGSGPLDTVYTFDTTIFATSTTTIHNFPVSGSDALLSSQLLELTGTVTLVSYDRDALAGTFDTEMLSMSLSGTGTLDTGELGLPFGVLPVSVALVESSSQQSSGQATITDLGGGNFHVDSFFDVWTEISVQNVLQGSPEEPSSYEMSSSSSTHLELVPEPNSLVLASFAAIGLLGLRRRRA